MDLLTGEHVTKQYAGHKALDDVSLAIPKGSVYGLLGPNGAGKTTLFKILTGELDFDEGDVHIGQLRKKLELYDEIRTIPKLGYRLEE